PISLNPKGNSGRGVETRRTLMDGKIAVLGAGGQLGGELCRRWPETTIPLMRPEFDLSDAVVVRKTLLDLKPDAVVNAAAYTQVDRAEQEPEQCFAVNAHAVGQLAQVCRNWIARSSRSVAITCLAQT